MMDQTQINDIIIILRDLVKDFDKTIDQAKLVKGKALGGDFSSTIHLARKVSVLVKKYKRILNTLKDTDLSIADELSRKYIYTYKLYIETVSLPYIRDLILEIKEIISNKEEQDPLSSKALNDLIRELEEINLS
ncbi:MAG: hypothetical protein GXO43_04335 [Crenarchaeota archaeon]|nr:hypothetical protein [Thermoproteota archaeon]